VGLMVWLYIMAAVFLAGAEMVYVYRHRRTAAALKAEPPLPVVDTLPLEPAGD